MTRPMSQRQAISIQPWLRSRYVAAAFSQGATLITTYALIQSIYPLIVFILVALDKAHHSRGPRVSRNGWSKERGPPVNIALEVNMERGTALSPRSAYPMEALPYADGSTTAVDDRKLPDSGTA